LSTAFLLQSIGGGGGAASVVLHNNAAPARSSLSTSSSDHRALQASPVPAMVPLTPVTTLTLGASGGSGLHGGDIISTRSGTISTSGQNALGLVAQSIGAGGGEVRHSGTEAVRVEMGGTNLASGNGGKVAIINTGNIQTTGKGGNAVFLQSIGGGGGAAFTGLDPADVTVVLNTQNNGNGGIIDLIQTGNIIASGEDSIAVFAQSLGGGGGVIDRIFMDTAAGSGSSGAVDLMLDGNIAADGLNGIGVFAQSRGSVTQGNIAVTLTADKILTFGTAGSGVWLSGGAKNSFVNKGTIVGADGRLGWAARSTGGNDAVSNEKIFVGQFDLGAGANSFTNQAGALFIAGPQLLLGDAANMLRQSGTIRIGDTGKAQRSDLTGSYQQTVDGENFTNSISAAPIPTWTAG
jgi:hypothetical protein